jgi:hypothetical protein
VSPFCDRAARHRRRPAGDVPPDERGLRALLDAAVRKVVREAKSAADAYREASQKYE